MLKKKSLYLGLFILGIVLGAFWGLNKVKASSPAGETSGGEQPASTVYEEKWVAKEAYVSANTGYEAVDPSTHNATGNAGQFENTAGGYIVRRFPKFVVTKWRVHGHIHFR